MSIADELMEILRLDTDEMIQAEMRLREHVLVRACRRGEHYFDFPESQFWMPRPPMTRYLLPKTLFGRWWLLRKCGYRLRGPR